MDSITPPDNSPKLCECGCGQPSPIAKRSDTKHAHVKGQPMRFIRGHATAGRGLSDADVIRRFWSRVDKSGGPDKCWLWTGGYATGGYGSMRWQGRNHSAHRLAYIFTYGNILPVVQVCHRCDNPPCCNPAHLHLGSNTDNSLDKWRSHTQPVGETHHNAKLSTQEINEIRARYETGGVLMRDLAAEYGVGQATISRWVSRKSRALG
jgi:DNA-binding transcriptional regulator YiaG